MRPGNQSDADEEAIEIDVKDGLLSFRLPAPYRLFATKLQIAAEQDEFRFPGGEMMESRICEIAGEVIGILARVYGEPFGVLETCSRAGGTGGEVRVVAGLIFRDEIKRSGGRRRFRGFGDADVKEGMV